jgi:branched-chain amino acid transport system substrate-binding protein
MTGFLQILLVGVALATFLTPGPAPAQDTIKVGIVLPLSGDQAKFGEIEKLSFYLALEEINAAGGIKGKKLKFLFADDTGDPEAGRNVMEKLINNEKVVMLGGGYSSAVTYAMAGVAQQNGIPFLINTASADVITKKGYDYIFRLNPPVSDYASGLESFLTEVVKPKTAVILHESSLFGAEGARAFQNTCEKLGIKVLMVEGYEGWFRAFDFRPLLMRVKQADPDLIYMSSYLRDATLLMQLAQQLKLTPKLFVGGAAGFTLPEFAREAGKAAEKVITVTLWHQSLPIPGAREYFDKFKTTYQRDTEYHGAEAYAAAYVMADVLKRARSLAPEDLKQALHETDMQTVFGPVKFVSYGKMTNQNRLTTYVVQWQEGRLRLIWPADLARVKYVYPVDWLKEWGLK